MTAFTARMPVVFFGHGSPMNAIQPNRYAEAWRRVGAALPKPRAILSVSAHWYTRGTAVTAMATPRTIHDFYGFPEPLYEVRYPAPGDPALAARVRELAAPIDAALDESWGLDHGTWQVLMHAFPAANVPVVQLSIDGTKPGSFHYELGKRLGPLRDEVVLVIGSGNVVHNLGLMRRSADAPPYDWAGRFNDRVRALLVARDHAPLIDYASLGEDARLSIPTPDHYLPLLYCIALQGKDEKLEIPVDGIDIGSVGMLSLVIG
ncbi:MAG: 4,5-DOPA dioxygenase extradiol [Bacteroidota bacterium]